MMSMRGYSKHYLIYSIGLIFGLGSPLIGKYTSEHTPVGDYGSIIARSADSIKNAVVEKVVFYPHGGTFATKNIERNGVLVRYEDAQATILMCHGFSCDKFDTAFLRRLFPRGRFNVMNFDFRAHGEKKGNQYCTLGSDEAYDVIAAAQFIRNHPDLKKKPLYVYGFSMGAVAAIEAEAKIEEQRAKTVIPNSVAMAIDAHATIEERGAGHHPQGTLFDAMILDCPFDSAENVIKRGLEQLKFSLFGYTFSVPGRQMLQKYAFHPYVQSLLRIILKAVANMDSRDISMRVFPVDPVKTIAKIAVPICLIHCKKDEKVSIDGIKAVYNNSKASYKTLWITNGRNHFDSFFYNPEKYTEHVRNFLEQALAGSIYHEKKQEIVVDEDDQIMQS